MFGPVVYGPEDARSTLQLALVVYPAPGPDRGIFAYLRQRMVADHRSYRLVRRGDACSCGPDRRNPGRRAPGASTSVEGPDLPAWSRLPISARASAAAALRPRPCPLIGSGLAVAGVKLPGFAASPSATVGIELPNQDAESEAAAAGETRKRGDADGLRPASDSNDGPSEWPPPKAARPARAARRRWSSEC